MSTTFPLLLALHTRELPPEVTRQLAMLREFSLTQRLTWTETPYPECPEPQESPDRQSALVLGLLLEARHAHPPDDVLHWAEVAESFLKAYPLPEAAAVPLRVLALLYTAEGWRRKRHGKAARAFQEAHELIEAHSVEDPTVQAEMHFLAGKRDLEDRDRWESAREHFRQASRLYEELEDDLYRGHSLCLLACVIHRLDFRRDSLEPTQVLLQALALLHPDHFQELFVASLLELGHHYCDRRQFPFADDLRQALGKMAPQSRGLPARVRYQWLQARLAKARGDRRIASESYRAGSVMVMEPLLDALGLMMTVRDGGEGKAS